ncbi:MAG: 5-methyltetrahydropteroyltriglutamate--homocysteine S-methyltransferase [Alphaproteobacteria bacterium]|nr:5-methyltetrahydropteroyltriglutamate--homocysteine S-methyltransferase [Alphaproteobacteria bacterium]
MIVAANLGFPRIGAHRELKQALEQYWSGGIGTEKLAETGRSLRCRHWQLQRDCGVTVIPSNDFSFYDHVLDTTVMVGAVPERFDTANGPISLDTYFAMARGNEHAPAMEMTKWFDTNYHYIVPEFSVDQQFRLASDKPLREFREAAALHIDTRPVLIGPVTYLLLSKIKGSAAEPITLLPRLLPVYAQVVQQLRDAGARWIQFDEPFLVMDLDDGVRSAYRWAYGQLAEAMPDAKLMLTTYFGGLEDNLSLAVELPVAGLHVDLVRAPNQLQPLLSKLPAGRVLSLGVLDGRNIWRADLGKILDIVREARSVRGADRLQVAPSCSLLHCPVDLDLEGRLDRELESWLAFAKQKLCELMLVSQAANGNPDPATIARSGQIVAARKTSPRAYDPRVRDRLATVETMRRTPYRDRLQAQSRAIPLPVFPTTTIGSLPQTAEVRKWRAAFRRREIDQNNYESLLKGEIRRAIRWQEEIGLDVLVHGEFERSDMVEYFAERLAGFACTQHGWVQSYGSRCVKPPILYGDVFRPAPITVRWSRYAQSLTRRPVKGMLTGPITLLQWSFVRDDQPRDITARQLALAIRDEMADLEAAGIRILQIDEPALREGLPLRRALRSDYLASAVTAFRLATSGAAGGTQLHTHMCYAQFDDIIPSIANLDVDVISLEASRSHMELLGAFGVFQYPRQIGPGIYDIHSPRIPTEAEMEMLLKKATAVLTAEQIWVNPDCGLKTRSWDEVRPALTRMVAAAKSMRRLYEVGSFKFARQKLEATNAPAAPAVLQRRSGH